jgi:diaminopimelate decarboxylase
LLRSLGSRVDANSWGEIQVARRAGFDAKDIVFTGVGKTRDELESAIALEVGTINAESAGELDRIAAIAGQQQRVARVALRVNPDIDARSHPNISTGLKSNKFGVPIDDARAIYAERRAISSLRFVGVHVHIGSQITTAEPLARAANVLVSLARELCEDGVLLEENRLKPKRNSFTIDGLNVCVSLKVKIWRNARTRSPKPGIVLPVRSGSRTSER